MGLATIIVPTIRGREKLLERAVDAYRLTAPKAEVLVVRDRPSCGAAWRDGIAEATGEYVHLGADDVVPVPGWLEVAVDANIDRVLPAPRIVREDGSVEACGSLGGGMLLPDCPDGTRCYVSSLPTLPRATLLEFPQLPPLHYYADDWLSWQAQVGHATVVGMGVEVRRGYEFLHLEGTVGRAKVAGRAMADKDAMLRDVAGVEPAS